MRRRRVWLMMSLLASAFLSACAARDHGPLGPIAAYDRLVSPGEIQVAEEHLKGLGFDPGPVDGVFTDQTAEALRQYQQRYGLVVSGLLDRATRRELLPGVDTPRDGNDGLMILGGPQ